MTTTIQSTSLDFDAIKNNLKRFLQQGGEFTDYNFEASGLSNLLDVLAYNTHYNGLTANFALNESFLSTAQLRSSVVGLAGGLGYVPDSRNASFAVVNLSASGLTGSPSTVTIPAGVSFSAVVDDQTYTFQTREAMIAQNNAGNYAFTVDDSEEITITEGVATTKTFIAGPQGENDVYVIPNTNMDLDTVTVKVYPNASSALFDTYTNVTAAVSIDENSKIYSLKESPNGFFELTFSNGSKLGQTPAAGNKIEVEFLTVNGPAANGARTFTPDVDIPGYPGFQFTVVTVANSTGGAEKESIDSIRKNAPYIWGSQNRMVTAVDYAALIRRNFGSLISDIQTWGGEDNVPANYGNVYISIKYKDGVTNAIKVANQGDIRNLAQQLSIVSFDVVFVDPIETYVELEVQFQFNTKLTTISSLAAETAVLNAAKNYFTENVGGFGDSFRRSRLLPYIDDADTGILSSRAIVKMQQRIEPGVNLGTPTEYLLTYPGAIKGASNDDYVITSSEFVFNNSTCIIRNKLGSTALQIISSDGATISDNAGNYVPGTGVLTLNGFAPTSIPGGATEIRVNAIPSNEGTITPIRNNLLLFDDVNSSSKANLTTSS